MPKTPDTLTFHLKNEFSDNTKQVYANITGFDSNHNNDLCILRADGQTPFYPPPLDTYDHTKITQDIAIPLGCVGVSKQVTIPKLFSARIYFSIGHPLTFYLNRKSDISNKPALAEPSVSNPTADTTVPGNYNILWGFCELTYNDKELFCNISYVDFIGLPIALDLTTLSGCVQQVKGIKADGINTIATALKKQTSADNQPWSSLVITNDNNEISRVLSPNQGNCLYPTRNLFENYYQSYVDSVWQKFLPTCPLTIDTQDGTWGVISGTVDPCTNLLTFDVPSLPGGKWTFAQPTTANIFNCSNGPFDPANDEKGNISARLAAAFNRTTLLDSSNQPDSVPQSQYYTKVPTNHYSRIVHAVNLDHLGYAFPYDDVSPTSAPFLAGKVEATDPDVFTVTVGGAQWGQ